MSGVHIRLPNAPSFWIYASARARFHRWRWDFGDGIGHDWFKASRSDFRCKILANRDAESCDLVFKSREMKKYVHSAKNICFNSTQTPETSFSLETGNEDVFWLSLLRVSIFLSVCRKYSHIFCAMRPQFRGKFFLKRYFKEITEEHFVIVVRYRKKVEHWVRFWEDLNTTNKGGQTGNGSKIASELLRFKRFSKLLFLFFLLVTTPKSLVLGFGTKLSPFIR